MNYYNGNNDGVSEQCKSSGSDSPMTYIVLTHLLSVIACAGKGSCAVIVLQPLS